MGRWIATEAKFQRSKKGSKHVKHSRQGRYPEMREEYKDLSMSARGLNVKNKWFKVRVRPLMEELNPS